MAQLNFLVCGESEARIAEITQRLDESGVARVVRTLQDPRYLQSELGSSATFTRLALDVATIPGQSLAIYYVAGMVTRYFHNSSAWVVRLNCVVTGRFMHWSLRRQSLM